MGKVAFLFPGQGSQYVGMGLSFYQEFPLAKEIFNIAEDITARPIKRLCFEGPLDELTQTVNLQPAITTINLCAAKALEEEGFVAHVVAGHSLGEYAALTSVSALSPNNALKLVNARAYLMDREATRKPGAMAAIVGLNYDQVVEVVNEIQAEGVCSIANYNTSNQIVISGEKGPVAAASRLAVERGAKAIPLNVSGAWHCSLMAQAQLDFQAVLNDTIFNEPLGDILFNVTADVEKNVEKSREIMGKQICSPVRWHEIILRMRQDGVDTFIEVGPGKVLQGLVKRILPKGEAYILAGIEDLATLRTVVDKRWHGETRS